MTFAFYVEIFVLVLFSFWFIFFIVQAYNIFFRGFAPFVATKKEIVQKSLDEIKLDENKIVYELGCGRAGFLHAVRRRYPKTRLIGVEYALLPVLLAKIQNWLLKDNIQIVKKDIFKVDLKEADLVYCYLNGQMMEQLKDKFKKELKPGSQIISFKFKLKDWNPSKVIESDNNKIYFYTV